jgi:hypothetical protein
MLNPFFQQGSFGEQSLIQDLINEQLKIYGVDVYYLPRKYITEKTVIKEVIESKFDISHPIEAYIDNYEGYGGNGTILSKFGIQDVDDLTLIISKDRFDTYIAPLIRNNPNIKLGNRPKEGDLIYFPLGDRLFEIKYVEHEKPFYQLQKNYVYELRCELFRYEDEDLDTSIDFIDDNVVNEGYIQTLTLIGAGVTATAITSVVNGGVRSIRVTNRGNGYTSTPQVAISSAPFGGRNAVGVATMINSLVDCVGIKSSRVQGVELINPGIGYTLAPNVVFVGGGGSGAAATSVIGNGLVGIVTITNGGSGYTNISPPTVTFSGPGIGTTAIGYAVVNSSGSISQIRILDAGVGYTTAPTITIESPYSSGIGTYKFNEEIIGSISGSSAKVKSWNVVSRELKVSIITGTFVPGEIITGQDSGATYELRVLNTDNIVDPYADNDNIEELADTIIDFSENNPFGMP